MLGLEAVEGHAAQSSEREWQDAMDRFVPLTELQAQRTPQRLQVFVIQRCHPAVRVDLERFVADHFG